MVGRDDQDDQFHLRSPKIFNPLDLDQVRRAIDQLDVARAEFSTWLRSVPRQHWTKRPAAKQWSALEHVRHLVTAEETYIDLWITRNRRNLSDLGLPPDFLKDRPAYRHVGRKPCHDLEQVLAAWTEAHGHTNFWRERPWPTSIATQAT